MDAPPAKRRFSPPGKGKTAESGAAHHPALLFAIRPAEKPALQPEMEAGRSLYFVHRGTAALSARRGAAFSRNG